MHAVEVEDLVDVDADDPRVRVRGAQDGRVQQVRVPVHADVVDVPAQAAQEALVLDALDRGAHQLRGHPPSPVVAASEARSSCSSCPGCGFGGAGGVSPLPSRASSAARSTDRTMFW